MLLMMSTLTLLAAALVLLRLLGWVLGVLSLAFSVALVLAALTLLLTWVAIRFVHDELPKRKLKPFHIPS